MIDINTLLFYILLFGALSLPGFFLGKLKLLGDNSVKHFTVLLTNVAMPALVLSCLLKTDLRALELTELLCAALLPIALCLALWLICSLCFRRTERTKKAAASFCCIFPNCGFLGIPLANVLFPDNAKVSALVAIFNVFSSFMLLTLGIYILSGDKKHVKPLGILVKPVTIALAVGLTLSLLGVAESVPAVTQYAEILAALTTPLSMLVLGIQLSSFKFKELFLTPQLYSASAIRLLVSPFLSMGVLMLLRAVGVDISIELASAIFISTGVSTAATASAMAQGNGADGRHAALLTLGSTVLCAFTLPLLSLLFGLFFN